VVDECQLVPIDVTTVLGIGGLQVSEVYLVNIALPNGMVFPEISVTKSEDLGDYDVLIGMDIINAGDFAVTNPGGHTQFTFRVPSQANINFVAEDRWGRTKGFIGQVGVAAAVGIAIAIAVQRLLAS